MRNESEHPLHALLAKPRKPNVQSIAHVRSVQNLVQRQSVLILMFQAQNPVRCLRRLVHIAMQGSPLMIIKKSLSSGSKAMKASRASATHKHSPCPTHCLPHSMQDGKVTCSSIHHHVTAHQMELLQILVMSISITFGRYLTT